ncbi:mannose 6-phosphate receptor domain-containing protein [Apiospora arundinis]|uniref:Mannose 6-phosphate receptor domain-containing protein n=1 Tax=Apiospora arundinis TaxID=335852 RepID=A0ABR2J4U6_9PEZI
MRSIFSFPPAFLALLLAAGASTSLAADPEKTPTTTACTASTTAGSFFDLRPDIAKKGGDTKSKHLRRGEAPHKDYHARGWDYGFNFTLNVCEPVVETPDNVRGLDRDSWQNISAYYVSKGDVYSLGAASGALTTRGRKLVLQYSGGSPCGKSSKRDASGHHLNGKRSSRQGASYKDYSDDEAATATKTGSSSARSTLATVAKATDTPQRRKSATISFLCDRDPTASTAAVSFVGADPDECAYFFEMRSQHACAGAEPHAPGSVGPGYLFVIIIFIAILVYLGGGIMYQRTVANQRGWRQLPNYTLWSNIWSHISDFFVIVTSSCARLLPSRRGYHYVSGSPSRGRYNRDREAENRLIDQYDEEWDD